MLTVESTSIDHVRSVISSLFGSSVTLSKENSPQPPASNQVVSTYVDSDGVLKRLLICDLAFANSAGAALSMIPPRLAQESTAEGKIPDNLKLNCLEVFNIFSNLWKLQISERNTWGATYWPDSELPEAVTAAVQNFHPALSVSVRFNRYPTGQLHLLVANDPAD